MIKRRLARKSLQDQNPHVRKQSKMELENRRLRKHLTILVARETYRHALLSIPEERQCPAIVEEQLSSAFPLPSKIQHEMVLMDTLLRIDPVAALTPVSGALAPTKSQLLLLVEKSKSTSPL